MSKENITTIIKIIESIPDSHQEKIIEYLKEYIADIQDELKWNQSFQKTQNKLVEVATQVKEKIIQGEAKTMDYKQL